MKYKIFNEDNLKDEEIDYEVVRVKAFIMNSKNELLVASSYGGIQLIGGHAEEGEEYIKTLIREIKEEAGIEVLEQEISGPFYEIKHYTRDYFNSKKNVISKVVYYSIKTDKAPSLENANHTKREEDGNFSLKIIPYDKFEEVLGELLKSSERVHRIIADETLSAFKELTALYS